MMNETDVGGEGENQRHIFWGMRSKEQGVGKKRVGIEYTLQFKRYVNGCVHFIEALFKHVYGSK